MRRRISLLVAATTSAVILAFLIPLGLLVRTLAEDRAIAGASQEAQGSRRSSLGSMTRASSRTWWVWSTSDRRERHPSCCLTGR